MKQSLQLYIGTMAMIIATALVISGQDLMSTKAYIRDLLEVFDIEPE